MFINEYIREAKEAKHPSIYRKKEKGVVSFMHKQKIICSQTKLDNIVHEQTIIWRQLFTGHNHGGLSANKKEE